MYIRSCASRTKKTVEKVVNNLHSRAECNWPLAGCDHHCILLEGVIRTTFSEEFSKGLFKRTARKNLRLMGTVFVIFKITL